MTAKIQFNYSKHWATNGILQLKFMRIKILGSFFSQNRILRPVRNERCMMSTISRIPTQDMKTRILGELANTYREPVLANNIHNPY